MSYTSTPNYALKKPNVNSDNDVWGDHLNQDMDTLDSVIHGIDTRAQVTSFNTRTGAVTLGAADITSLGFATTTTNDASYVNVGGDTMTGPLALSGNAVSGLQAVPLQQLNAAVPQPGTVTPGMDSVGAPGTSTLYARQDHIHPTDTSRYAASNPSGYQTAAQVTTALAPYAPLASPALTGTPSAPTVTPSTDSSTKLATTAFVQSVVGALPAYAPLASPVFTGDARAVTPAPGDNDTSIATTAFVGNALGGYATTAASANNVGRNLIHNALFNVAQRGTGPWTTNGYTLDRWFMAFSGGTLSTTRVVQSDGSRAQIGDEASTNIIVLAVAGTSGVNDYAQILQPVEGVQRLSGKTVTVSFWAAGSVAGLKVGVSYDQIFGTGGSPSASALGSGQSVTLTTAWARYSVTLSVASATGKTLGTNNDDRTQLDLWVSAGANLATRSGSVGVQSGNINLWGIQLELGTVATPLDYGGSYADQLRACQRYYQAGQLTLQSVATGASQPFSIGIPPPVTMRSNATMVITTNGLSGVIGTPVLSHNGSSFNLQGTSTGSGAFNLNVLYSASADL